MASEMSMDVLDVDRDDRVQVHVADPVTGNRKWLTWFALSAAESFTSNAAREVLYLTNANGQRCRQRWLVCPFGLGGLWRELTPEQARAWMKRTGRTIPPAFARALDGGHREEYPARFTMQLRVEEKEAWERAAAAADMSLAAWIRWIVNAAYEEATQ